MQAAIVLWSAWSTLYHLYNRVSGIYIWELSFHHVTIPPTSNKMPAKSPDKKVPKGRLKATATNRAGSYSWNWKGRAEQNLNTKYEMNHHKRTRILVAESRKWFNALESVLKGNTWSATQNDSTRPFNRVILPRAQALHRFMDLAATYMSSYPGHGDAAKNHDVNGPCLVLLGGVGIFRTQTRWWKSWPCPCSTAYEPSCTGRLSTEIC